MKNTNELGAATKVPFYLVSHNLWWVLRGARTEPVEGL